MKGRLWKKGAGSGARNGGEPRRPAVPAALSPCPASLRLWPAGAASAGLPAPREAGSTKCQPSWERGPSAPGPRRVPAFPGAPDPRAGRCAFAEGAPGGGSRDRCAQVRGRPGRWRGTWCCRPEASWWKALLLLLASLLPSELRGRSWAWLMRGLWTRRNRAHGRVCVWSVIIWLRFGPGHLLSTRCAGSESLNSAKLDWSSFCER